MALELTKKENLILLSKIIGVNYNLRDCKLNSV